MAVKKVSKKGKGSFAAYKAEDRFYKNKIKKLVKHLKQFPDDEAAQKRLEKLRAEGKVAYQRKKPVTVGGWNRARPSQKPGLSRDDVISSLTKSQARIFAEVYKQCDSTRRSMTKAEQEITKKNMAIWANLEYQLSQKKAKPKPNKKAKNK